MEKENNALLATYLAFVRVCLPTKLPVDKNEAHFDQLFVLLFRAPINLRASLGSNSGSPKISRRDSGRNNDRIIAVALDLS